jgi:glycerophosphoryl diester phosphodiesterase
MRRLVARFRAAHGGVRAVLRPVIAFEIWATLIFVVSLAPASGWLLNRLVATGGQYAVTDLDLLAFLVTARGVLFVLLTIGFVLAFMFAEQVGLLVIVVNAARGRRLPVSVVLWENMTRLPGLLRLALLQAAAAIALAAPFALALGLIHRLLLGEWDFYFYLSERPPRFWAALALAGTLAAAYGLLAAWLFVRWIVAVPVLVFEGAGPAAALRTSWHRTRGRTWGIALPLAAWWLVVVVSAAATTWLVRAAAALLLERAGLSLGLVIPTVVGALALVALTDLLCFIVGKIVHVMIVAETWHDTTGETRPPAAPEPTAPRIPPRGLRRVAWIVAGVALVMGVGGGAAFVERLNVERTVEITGHRGSKLRAPENTLSAIRQAIDEGADFAEIDAQTTADGVVVLLHDGDLMRVASVPRHLGDVTRDELRTIDVGSWFDPAFRDERVPTLQEAIDVARGRIRLNIELKYTRPDPTLAPNVGRIIERNGLAGDCVVSSLRFEALAEIRGAVPDVTTGFIVFRGVGDLPRMEADFLSVSAAKATPRLVRRAHRRGRKIHAWGVGDLDVALAMIETGVDNIITDHPRDVRRLLDAWRELSDTERIALMLRRLIVPLEIPEPSEP